MGISCDSPHSQRAWAEQIGLTLPLLSDFWPHGETAKKYGVLRDGGFPERAIFLVDKQGVVRYIDVHQIGEQPDEEAIFEELAKLR